MSWDFEESYKRNIIKKKYIYGDIYFRIGNPFEWIDGNLQLSKQDFSGVIDLLQWYSGYYEKYNTLKEFLYKDYQKDLDKIKYEFNKIFDFYFPFLKKSKEYQNNIECHSLARVQDLCVIKKFCENLNKQKKKIKHLDFGSGLGGASTYSLKILNSDFISIEAHKWSYQIQRMFYRKIINDKEKYLDLVSAESFGLTDKEINLLINSNNYKIKQIPSWYFDEIKKESQDLITATTCLNEINNAGIIYFIVEANRTLKKNGYLYIRDSNKRKPGRNIVNYDEIFEKVLGYKVIKKFQLKNRKDIFAIPRLYQKTKNNNYEFTELFNKIIGLEAVTSHGSIYDQNVKSN
jgi:hypothetical protein